jgi:hypothetical protein
LPQGRSCSLADQVKAGWVVECGDFAVEQQIQHSPVLLVTNTLVGLQFQQEELRLDAFCCLQTMTEGYLVSSVYKLIAAKICYELKIKFVLCSLTKPVERIVAWLKVKEHYLVLQNEFQRQSFEAAARLGDFPIVCTPHRVTSAKSIQKNMRDYLLHL